MANTCSFEYEKLRSLEEEKNQFFKGDGAVFNLLTSQKSERPKKSRICTCQKWTWGSQVDLNVKSGYNREFLGWILSRKVE